ncbi:hypothetical protein [Shewanella marina]|uniref:hypothetical protein n=1 Tax=Shewanella marina TaxID=487319 RepID=UPI0004703A8A|nr:hypothetical protein [Shewanella marina]
MIETAITVTQGLNIDALCQQLRTGQHIVFHAALYSNFAGSRVEQVLTDRLSSSPQTKLYLIEQAFDPSCGWHTEFGQILRQQLTLAEIEQLFQQSRHWCQKLHQLYPHQVEYLISDLLPCQPILVIDNHIFSGQYAHAEIGAPQGIWLQINGQILAIDCATTHSWLQQAAQLTELSPAQISFYRYMAECRHVIKNATRFDSTHVYKN